MNAFVEFLNREGSLMGPWVWPMLWQSSLLIAAFFVVELALRRKVSAAVRYGLWMVVLVKLVLPPSLALPTGVAWWVRPPKAVAVSVLGAQPTHPSRAANRRPEFVDAAVLPAVYVDPTPAPTPPAELAIRPNRQTATPADSIPPAQATPRPALSVPGLILLAGLAGSALLLAWLTGRTCQVAWTASRGCAATDSVPDLLESARRQAGLRQSVRLRVTERALSPAVYGLLRPTILVPRSLLGSLSPDQMRAVLLHECIHIRRGDVWVNCAQSLLQIAYWWHPLLWLANGRIQRAREEAVDDAVMLALRDDADLYPTTLFEVAKLAVHRPVVMLGLVGLVEPKSALRQRIERLVDFVPPARAGLSLASLLGIMAFTAVAVPMGQAPGRADLPVGPDAPQRVSTNAPAPGKSSVPTASQPNSGPEARSSGSTGEMSSLGGRTSQSAESATNSPPPLVGKVFSVDPAGMMWWAGKTNNGDPLDLAGAVRSFLLQSSDAGSSRTQVIPDPRTQQLIVMTTSEEMKAVERLISSINADATTNAAILRLRRSLTNLFVARLSIDLHALDRRMSLPAGSNTKTRIEALTNLLSQAGLTIPVPKGWFSEGAPGISSAANLGAKNAGYFLDLNGNGEAVLTVSATLSEIDLIHQVLDPIAAHPTPTTSPIPSRPIPTSLPRHTFEVDMAAFRRLGQLTTNSAPWEYTGALQRMLSQAGLSIRPPTTCSIDPTNGIITVTADNTGVEAAQRVADFINGKATDAVPTVARVAETNFIFLEEMGTNGHVHQSQISTLREGPSKWPTLMEFLDSRGWSASNESARKMSIIEFHKTPLPDAIFALAHMVGINIAFDPSLMGKGADGQPIPQPRISILWKDSTALQTLKELLDKYGWQMAKDPATHISTISQKAGQAQDPPDRDSDAPDGVHHQHVPSGTWETSSNFYLLNSDATPAHTSPTRQFSGKQNSNGVPQFQHINGNGSAAHLRIQNKLNQIRIDRVDYDNLPLDEVLKSLKVESKKRDADGVGVNFLVNNRVDNSPQETTAHGSSLIPELIAVPAPTLVDITKVKITTNSPLSDLTLAQVLDAIVQASDTPIRYTVEDYGVEFSPKSEQTEVQYDKIFKVNTQAFTDIIDPSPVVELGGASGSEVGAGLVFPIDVNGLILFDDIRRNDGFDGIKSGHGGGMARAPGPGRPFVLHQLVNAFFSKSGITLNPPKFVVFSDRSGLLFVRGNLQDIERVQKIIEVINRAPTQIQIECRLVEMASSNLDRLLPSPANFAITNAGGDTRAFVLPEAQVRLLLGELVAPSAGTLVSNCKFVVVDGLPGSWTLGAADTGLRLDATLEVQPDGIVMRLRLGATRTLSKSEFTADLLVTDGATVMLENSPSQAGPAVGTGVPSGQRRFLLISPVMIDPAGNLLHQHELKRPAK